MGHYPVKFALRHTKSSCDHIKRLLPPFGILPDFNLILQTVQDKEMSELKEMAKRLQLPTPTVQVIKEKRDIPTLETITGLMMAKLPTQNVPNTAVCEKIGYIFSKLSEASKAYGEAAEALAEVSADVSPEHYMLFTLFTLTD